MAAVGGQTETRERSETVDFATGPSYVMYSMIYERFPAHTRTYERCEEGQSELSTAQSLILTILELLVEHESSDFRNRGAGSPVRDAFSQGGEETSKKTGIVSRCSADMGSHSWHAPQEQVQAHFCSASTDRYDCNDVARSTTKRPPCPATPVVIV
jgi:hypothetical protein